MIIPLDFGNEFNYTKCTFSSYSPYASFSQICAKYSRKLRKVISGVSESVCLQMKEGGVENTESWGNIQGWDLTCTRGTAHVRGARALLDGAAPRMSRVHPRPKGGCTGPRGPGSGWPGCTGQLLVHVCSVHTWRWGMSCSRQTVNPRLTWYTQKLTKTRC